MRRQLAIFAALLLSVLWTGCASSDPATVATVRSVASRWLTAQRDLDGRTYCALLDPARLARQEAAARRLNRHATCTQLAAATAPGMDPRTRAEVRSLVREANRGLRVEEASVSGAVAQVGFSARAPKNPNISYHGDELRDGRYYTSVTLRRIHGVWLIGLDHE